MSLGKVWTGHTHNGGFLFLIESSGVHKVFSPVFTVMLWSIVQVWKGTNTGCLQTLQHLAGSVGTNLGEWLEPFVTSERSDDQICVL